MTGVGFAVTGVIESNTLNKGNPERLVNGMDYHGNICGISNYVTSRGENVMNLPKAYFLPSGLTICIPSCPMEKNFDKFYCQYEIQAEIEQRVAIVAGNAGIDAANNTQKSLGLYYTSTKQCMPHLKTTPYLGYCRPDVPIEVVEGDLNQKFANESLHTSSNFTIVQEEPKGTFFDKAMADAKTSRYVIFGFGLGAAMILGLIFLVLIQTPGVLTTMVWSIVIGIFIGLIGAGHYMSRKSAIWMAQGIRDDREIIGLFWLSRISYVASGLWFVTICCLRKRIVLAIACVKEASRAMAAMPIITILPIIQAVGLFVFCIPWGIFMAYLASSGEITAECMCSLDQNDDTEDSLILLNSTNISNSTNGTAIISDDSTGCGEGCFLYKSFSYSQNTKYAGLYMLFVWFWTSQFIVAIGQLVVSISTAMWYFTKNKIGVGNGTFFKALILTLMYHLGTAAFGSLIIAIIKTIRAMFAYIQRKLSSKPGSKTVQIILRVIQCCLWCIEKCMKFINKNAYIQTAIFGYSFCKASRMAFFLILRNVLRISAVSLVSDFVLLIGKLFIVVTSTIGAYFFLDYHYSDELNGLWLSTMLVCLISYATAEMFNEVFGMAISTILQCFVADEEMFLPEDRFAPGSLAQTIDSTEEKHTSSNTIYPKASDGKSELKKKHAFAKKIFS
uniref:Choline transporter-like protein n=2 Tax=Ditylum brightwellii TaxID=49249 RepID=A0A7S4TAG2_9STRA|mmetsp:Transcript_51125/g.76616  ORF Transcript_51125/g.76616 Transcript_51125/m.76616 type:complete len:673 (+) Transcript_51125:347-2365(+)